MVLVVPSVTSRMATALLGYSMPLNMPEGSGYHWPLAIVTFVPKQPR
jgi:hypothetical protein